MISEKINNRKNINVLLICSPSFNSDCSHPYLAVPLLSGQLKQVGFSTFCKDYDIEYNYDLLSTELIENSYKKIISNIKKYTPDFYHKAKLSGKYNDFELKSVLYKVKKYKFYVKNNYIENLYKQLKKYVCESKKLTDENIRLANIFHFLPYIYDRTLFSQNYDFIKSICFDTENNFFIDYFTKKIKDLPKNPDLIVISKMPDFHVFHFLTLCRILKVNFKNSKIAIGGSIFSTVYDDLKKYPDFFDIFCDYVAVGDGETSVVELAKYINEEKSINQVSNILYKGADGKIYQNPSFNKFNINNVAYADYNDYDFSKYTINTGCVSMILSKGCYWGKCNFCSYTTANNKIQIKTISNVIKEIKYYMNKYNVNSFLFVDDAISPFYYSHLADRILENKLSIDITSFAIMDKNFTYEVLSKMKKAGVRRLLFGLDTHSRKVFNLVNKSGDFDARSNILKNTHKVGIRTQINFISGLPGENLEDSIQTIKFLYDHIACIDSYALFNFYLDVNSNFAKYPDKFGLKVFPKEDFSFVFPYEKTDSDITPENSFYYFHQKYTKSNKDFLKKHYRPLSREALYEICRGYLKNFAPEFL